LQIAAILIARPTCHIATRPVATIPIGQVAGSAADAIGRIAIAQGIARVTEVAATITAVETTITASGVASSPAQILRLSRGAALIAVQEITHLIVRGSSRLILAATEFGLRARRACAIRVKGPRAAALRLSAYGSFT
jgi:hypothetical protein